METPAASPKLTPTVLLVIHLALALNVAHIIHRLLLLVNPSSRWDLLTLSSSLACCNKHVLGWVTQRPQSRSCFGIKLNKLTLLDVFIKLASFEMDPRSVNYLINATRISLLVSLFWYTPSRLWRRMRRRSRRWRCLTEYRKLSADCWLMLPIGQKAKVELSLRRRVLHLARFCPDNVHFPLFESTCGSCHDSAYINESLFRVDEWRGKKGRKLTS